MIDNLNFIDGKMFEIDGVRFFIDTTPGPKRKVSENNMFTIVKTKKYLEEYLNIQIHKDSYILELGMFEGGSLVFFDKIFKPQKMVGIDIRKDPIVALCNYIETEAPHIITHYNTSQDDKDRLYTILEKDLDGKLDLVVDDASHLYELTKASFVYLFPKLNPGGLYIIEDWAWSLKPNAQNNKHPWFKKAALVNLIFEIITELGSTDSIDNVFITNRMIKIKKSKIDLDKDNVLKQKLLRGRKLFIV